MNGKCSRVGRDLLYGGVLFGVGGQGSRADVPLIRLRHFSLFSQLVIDQCLDNGPAEARLGDRGQRHCPGLEQGYQSRLLGCAVRSALGQTTPSLGQGECGDARGSLGKPSALTG